MRSRTTRRRVPKVFRVRGGTRKRTHEELEEGEEPESDLPPPPSARPPPPPSAAPAETMRTFSDMPVLTDAAKQHAFNELRERELKDLVPPIDNFNERNGAKHIPYPPISYGTDTPRNTDAIPISADILDFTYPNNNAHRDFEYRKNLVDNYFKPLFHEWTRFQKVVKAPDIDKIVSDVHTYLLVRRTLPEPRFCYLFTDERMKRFQKGSVTLTAKIMHFNELVVKSIPRVDADWLMERHYKEWCNQYQAAYRSPSLVSDFATFAKLFITLSISYLYTNNPSRWVAYRPGSGNFLTPRRYTFDEYLQTDMFPNPAVLFPCVRYFDRNHKRMPDKREFEMYADQLRKPSSYTMRQLQTMLTERSTDLIIEEVSTTSSSATIPIPMPPRLAPMEEWYRVGAQAFQMIKKRTPSNETEAAATIPLLFDCINSTFLSLIAPYNPLIPILHRYEGMIGHSPIDFSPRDPLEFSRWLAFKLNFLRDGFGTPPMREQLTLSVPNEHGLPLPAFIETYRSQLNHYVIPELLAYIVYVLHLFDRTIFYENLQADHIFIYPHGTDLVPAHWELRQFDFSSISGPIFTLPCSAKIIDARNAYIYLGNKKATPPPKDADLFVANKTFRDALNRSDIALCKQIVTNTRYTRRDYQWLLHPVIFPHLVIETNPLLQQDLQNCPTFIGVGPTGSLKLTNFSDHLSKHLLEKLRSDVKPLHPDKIIKFAKWPYNMYY